MPSNDPIRVLMITGFGRSGSTVLDNTLGQYEGLFSAGEVLYLWDRGVQEDRLCGCGEPFSRCPVWTAVVETAFPEGLPDLDEMVRIRESYGPRQVLRSASEPPREYLDNLERVYRALAEVSGAAVIVDSSKTPAHGYMLERIAAIEQRAVHLIRDPRAVAYSWSKKKVYDPTGEAPMMMTVHSPARSARLWSTWNLATDMLWRSNRERYLRLRYEDLMAAPREQIESLVRFAGVEPAAGPFVSDDEVTMGGNHALAGNPSRFQSGPVRLRADAKWRDAFPRGKRVQVTALTWPLLLRYGYPLLA